MNYDDYLHCCMEVQPMRSVFSYYDTSPMDLNCYDDNCCSEVVADFAYDADDYYCCCCCSDDADSAADGEVALTGRS